MYRLGTVQTETVAGIIRYNALAIDGPQGTIGLAFTDDALRVLIGHLEEQLSGLTIARAFPTQSNGARNGDDRHA